jgi:hypothetical protein
LAAEGNAASGMPSLAGTIRNFVRGGAVEPIRPWLR